MFTLYRVHASVVVSYLACFGPGPPPDVVGEGAALSIGGALTLPWAASEVLLGPLEVQGPQVVGFRRLPSQGRARAPPRSGCSALSMRVRDRLGVESVRVLSAAGHKGAQMCKNMKKKNTTFPEHFQFASSRNWLGEHFCNSQ